MARGKTAEVPDEDRLRIIKQTVILAMFTDDELFDQLVLKGGNAMDLIHQTHARASVDVDFSMSGDLDKEAVRPRIERALKERFAEQGYLAFDISMREKPRSGLSEDLARFWGGYEIAFKLISQVRARELKQDREAMQREAIRLAGVSTRFTIDISRHEYTEGKQAYEIEGMTIFVYPPAMIVCEKLRAICQQMPDYGPVIGRDGAGSQRARDFIDIHVLLNDPRFRVDLADPGVQDMLRKVFEAKRVPLGLLGNIRETRLFHGTGYPGVKATMRPGVPVFPFDTYFDAVLDACKALEPLWHV
ncbi:MAG: nucleotidyl transferase AbiEii/AbiGii toxin family protein [Lautropia sp.]|nr:nucleotidyl transferase AbiEii/AbiGii toxin family protein [Lautropia sp.]